MRLSKDERAMQAELRTPSTAQQLVPRFGERCVKLMRSLSDKGIVVMAAPMWRDGRRWVYWVKPDEADTARVRYIRKRLAQLGVNVEQEEVL